MRTRLILVALVAGLALVPDTARAMTIPTIHFGLAGSSLGNLREADEPMTRHHMNTRIVDVTRPPHANRTQVPSGWTSNDVGNYKSYALFITHTDGRASNGELARSVRSVKYNPEQWAATPSVEQRNPPRYMALFCRRAHAVGRTCGTAPARTLMQVRGSVFRTAAYANCGGSGTLSERYLACNLAGHAAKYADYIDVQMQRHQNQPAVYEANIRAAFADARAANPGVKLRSNLSTSLDGTTAESLCAARRAVKNDFGSSPEGHWFHVSDDTKRIGIAFLTLVHKGRC